MTEQITLSIIDEFEQFVRANFIELEQNYYRKYPEQLSNPRSRAWHAKYYIFNFLTKKGFIYWSFMKHRKNDAMSMKKRFIALHSELKHGMKYLCEQN